ncbi:TPA: hypothetical protein ROA93_003447 [Escherichia coli]|nr:hypothetical protein [Escherichia coli]
MILNNQEWLLAIFKKKGLTPTGKLEFATIDGIDSALAQALNEAFDSQVVSFNDRINQSFREFLKRTPRDRITLGTFSDVKEWLSSFEADRAGRKDTASTCYIEGQKSIAFQDLTTGTADNRLFAVGLNLTVVAELPILAYMQQTTGTITVKAKILEE